MLHEILGGWGDFAISSIFFVTIEVIHHVFVR
jgi:hypothetical protein